MKFSRRAPGSYELNDWSARIAARRAAGAALIDLTETNPTRVGLTGEVVIPSAWQAGALARYDPDACGAAMAREAVARYYVDRGSTVDPAHILLSTGTSESYAHLFRVLADAGDTVLVPRPSYPLFEPLVRAEGLELATYRLAYDGRWHLDVAHLERAIGARCRALVVVQPNHPTGSCLDPAERRALESLCTRHGLAIIADEVFGDFPWPMPQADGVPTPPGPLALPSFIDSEAALTFVMSGLSKVCGLPHMKLGWIAAAGPPALRDAALERLEWMTDLFLSVSAPASLGAPEWLAARHTFQGRTRERMNANLARLDRAVARVPELTRVAADGGWVAVLRLPSRHTEEEWLFGLLDRGVIVHPGHFYDFEAEPFVVVSLITEVAEFDRGMTHIEATIAAS